MAASNVPAPDADRESVISSLASSADSQERGISEGVTSDSGLSDELGGGGHRKTMTDRRTARVTTALAAKTTTVCSMCDQELSTYMCSSCGRLSFCLKCCISLHDNRFLGGHKIEDLRNGLDVNVTTLRERQIDAAGALNTQRSAHFEEDLDETIEAVPEYGRAVLVNEEDPEALDMAGLAADQSVIQARLKELGNCSEILKKVGIEMSQELEVSREATSTAVEAVKRKFDILRNVINAKEDEFVAVVQEAGRARLDSASKGQTEANVVVSELQGFVAHTENQLDRLKGNKKLFNTSRRSMLETSEGKLNDADNSIHSLQDRLQSVRHQSLGLHINLEDSVQSIQRLKPPGSLTHRNFDPPHVTAMSSGNFVGSPGVKTFTQDREVPTSLGALQPVDYTTNANVTIPMAAPAQRQSFDKEINKLRSSPLPGKRNESPVRKPPAHSAAFSATSSRALEAAQEKAAAPQTSALLQRTAARRQQSPTRTATGRSSIFPPELEALRKQVSGNRSLASTAAGTAQGRAGSPMGRPGARTPTRGNGTPSGTPTRRADSPGGRRQSHQGDVASSSRASYDGHNPGPGSYGGQPNFGSRSVLSTPPRRR